MAAVPALSATTAAPPSQPIASSYPLKLGPVAFTDLEHPQSLPIPLTQQIAVHQQAGGTRTVQTFGAQPGPIQWKGTLFFNGAVARMGELRKLLTIGKEVVLSWGPLQWDVIVSKFEADVHHQFEIAYDITCEVVRDRTGQATAASAKSLDAQNQALFDQAQSRFQALYAMDPTADWNAQMDASAQQLQNSSPITQASAQQIAQAAAQVQATISTVTTYITPLTSKLDQGSLQKLFLAQGVLSNLQIIAANLGSGNPSKTVIVAGASLVDLATEHYGDPSLWTVIAAANGLWSMSPLSTAGTTIKIPPKPADTSNVPLGTPVVYS